MAPPARLTILADDLTGACDAAAPFAQRGRTSLVLLDSCEAREVNVAAYDLDVRDRLQEETYARVREAAARCVRAGDGVFAKIDSTLRGHIAEFLSGILDATASALALIAPAFPQQGRALVRGRLHLCAGNLGSDGLDLLDVLARTGHEAVHVCVAEGLSPAVVAQAIGEAHAKRIRFVVVDGTTDDHLRAVSRAWLDSASAVVLAGSGGLAGALATATAVGAPRRRQTLEGAGPVLVFAGSPALATRRQVNWLASGSQARVVRLRHEAVTVDDDGVVVFATTPADEASRIVRDGSRSSALLADCAFRVAAQCRPRAVILVGGASARAICQRLAVRGLALCGEAVPGVPWGFLRGGAWDGVPVLTKSGGFGAPALLADAVDWCKTEAECA